MEGKLRHTAIMHSKLIFKAANFKMNPEKKQGWFVQDNSVS